jgi:hypothetical protein
MTDLPEDRPHGRRWLLLASAVAVTLVVALLWTLAARDDNAARVVAGSEASTTTRPATAVSAADAMQKVESLTAIIHEVDRIEAKLVTEGELMSAGSPGTEVAGLQPDNSVWAVAVSGDLQTEFGLGMPVTWSIFWVDATTDGIKSQMADNGARWPPFFDALPGDVVIGK